MSKKIQELREQRAKLVHDARALLDTAKKEGRGMSDEDNGKFDELMSKADELDRQAKQEERLLEAEREAASVQADQHEEEVRSGRKDDAEMRTLAFRKAIMNGFGSLSADEARALQFDNDAQGGYLAPPEQFVNQLIKAVDDMVFIRQKATVYQLSGAHSIGAPSLEADPADAAWTAEVGSVSEDSTMSFGKRELTPHLLTKLVKVSMKLLRNAAMNPEMVVMDRLAYKFGISQEKAFLTGSGASQPLGVFTASNDGIPTGRDVSTGNTTTSIGADGLREAYYSVKAQYQRTGEWIFHRDAVKQIAKLKDGNGDYLWSPGTARAPDDLLLNRPVNQSEYAPNTFTTGLYVGIFGDFSNYWIVDSMAMQVQRLNELYAATSQVGFIGRMESDGAPVLSEAFARVTLA